MSFNSKKEFPFNMFPYFFGFVFFVIVSMIALQVYVGVVAVNQISENGLKGVSEQLWCGKDKSDECKEELRKTIKEGLTQ